MTQRQNAMNSEGVGAIPLHPLNHGIILKPVLTDTRRSCGRRHSQQARSRKVPVPAPSAPEIHRRCSPKIHRRHSPLRSIAIQKRSTPAIIGEMPSTGGPNVRQNRPSIGDSPMIGQRPGAQPGPQSESARVHQSPLYFTGLFPGTECPSRSVE